MRFSNHFVLESEICVRAGLYWDSLRKWNTTITCMLSFCVILEYKVLKINLLSTGNKIDLEKERHVSVQEAEM